MLSGWPEHKVSRHLSRDGVRYLFSLFQVNPFWPDAKHKLSLVRDRPRLLEEQVGVPLRRVPGIERGDACLQFKPVFDGRTLHSEVRRKGCRTSAEVPTGCRPHLKNGNSIVLVFTGCGRRVGIV